MHQNLEVDRYQLAEGMQRPIVSTSLNLAGEEPIRSYAEALAQFAQIVDLVLPGEIGLADGPSKILQLQDTGIQSLR